MNADILFQNIFTLFMIAIILEAAIMAIFSMTSMKQVNNNIAIDAARDALVVILAFILCYKVDILTVFKGTGVKLPAMLDTIISALVLTRLTNFIRGFLGKLRGGE